MASMPPGDKPPPPAFAPPDLCPGGGGSETRLPPPSPFAGLPRGRLKSLRERLRASSAPCASRRWLAGGVLLSMALHGLVALLFMGKEERTIEVATANVTFEARVPLEADSTPLASVPPLEERPLPSPPAFAPPEPPDPPGPPEPLQPPEPIAKTPENDAPEVEPDAAPPAAPPPADKERAVPELVPVHTREEALPGGKEDPAAAPSVGIGEGPFVVIDWSPEELFSVARTSGLRVVAVDSHGGLLGEVVSASERKLRSFTLEANLFSNRCRALPRSFLNHVEPDNSAIASFRVFVPVSVDRQLDTVLARVGDPDTIRYVEVRFVANGTGHDPVVNRIVRRTP